MEMVLMKTAKIIAALLLTALSAAFGTTSCTAPIEIATDPGESRLVVYSALVNGFDETAGEVPARQRVSVQRTLPFFSSATDGNIRDAVVTIEAAGTPYAALWDEETKHYLTAAEILVRPGATYSLTVVCDFDGDGTTETYTADTTPPDTRMEVDKIEIEAQTMFGLRIYTIFMWGRDFSGPDSYIFRIAVDDKIATTTLAGWSAENDRLFDGTTFDRFMFGTYPGKPDPDDPDRPYFSPGQKVTLLYANVDPDLELFVREVQSSGGSNPMFGGPPYNPRTNISGGAIGFFGSVCSSHISTTVPE